MKSFKWLLYSIISLFFTFSLTSAPLPKIPDGAPLPANLFVKLAEVINPTVVNISTETKRRNLQLPGGHNDPFFEFFRPFMNPQQQQPRQSLGTGFIIRKDGLILTNAHVIDKADIIKVQLNENDKTLYEATVIGKDKRTDVALIKISVKKDLPVAQLGSSRDVKVGEWVAAAGNPFGHGHTVTKGIISAKGREINELNRFPFLQTDASINPGNSGGPLVNTQGLVIGVNTAIDARAQGIGFAIPIDDVKRLLPSLEKKGFIERGFLGVVMTDLNNETAHALKLKNTDGTLITQVIPKSPADRAGIKPYDVITSIDNKDIKSTSDLIRIVSDTTVGTTLSLKLIRKGKQKTVKAKVTKNPQDNRALRKETLSKNKGKKALHNLGFNLQNMTPEQKKQLNLRNLHPIVSHVSPHSPASRSGLRVGDILLDVNTKPVYKVSNVNKLLTGKRTNILRIMRDNNVFLVYIRPKR